LFERNAIDKEKKVKQLEDFSLVLVEGGFFDVEVDSSDILVLYLPSLSLNPKP
jgi:hypothetical protein